MLEQMKTRFQELNDRLVQIQFEKELAAQQNDINGMNKLARETMHVRGERARLNARIARQRVRVLK